MLHMMRRALTLRQDRCAEPVEAVSTAQEGAVSEAPKVIVTRIPTELLLVNALPDRAGSTLGFIGRDQVGG